MEARHTVRFIQITLDYPPPPTHTHAPCLNCCPGRHGPTTNTEARCPKYRVSIATASHSMQKKKNPNSLVPAINNECTPGTSRGTATMFKLPASQPPSYYFQPASHLPASFSSRPPLQAPPLPATHTCHSLPSPARATQPASQPAT